MDLRRTFNFFLIGLLCLNVAYFAGFMTHKYIAGRQPEFSVLEQAYSILENHALYPLPDPPRLEYGMIYGMVDAYGDRFTSFVEPAQHEINSDRLEGKYGGIGAKLSYDDQGNILLYPFPDSPAAEAGIQDGDHLTAVDNLRIANDTPMDSVVAALRGPEGQRVTVTVTRPPDFTFHTYTIKRKEIPLPSVTWHQDPGEPRLGVVEINVIAASTADEIENAFSDLQDLGATHYVLDLRGNSGGLLDAGIEIARLFLEEGTVLEQQYRDEPVESFKVKEPGPLADFPLAVLVDEHTASAAEIVSGAIQAHDRAPLIGSQTFGKAVIQLVFDLEDSSSLHVTAAEWWIPGLENPVGEGGLLPDIPLDPEANEADPALAAAIRYLFEEE
jgi:carboxyl-terminal processing protease